MKKVTLLNPMHYCLDGGVHYTPCSVRIKNLIEDLNKFYTLKMRPSGHDIDKGFAKGMTPEVMPLYDRIAAGESVSIEEYRQQTALAL